MRIVRKDGWQDNEMDRLLPAIVLCMALQPAWADEAAAGKAVTGGMAPQAMVEVKLAKAAPGHRNPEQAPIVVAALHGDAAPAPDTQAQPERQSTRGMLLAALALMAGIVLRRWGADQR